MVGTVSVCMFILDLIVVGAVCMFILDFAPLFPQCSALTCLSCSLTCHLTLLPNRATCIRRHKARYQWCQPGWCERASEPEYMWTCRALYVGTSQARPSIGGMDKEGDPTGFILISEQGDPTGFILINEQ